MSVVRKEERSEAKKPKASKSKKDKAKGTVECRGYYDEYGIWNNGFQCPRWGGIEEQYCCGTQYEKYCCPKPDPTTTPTTSQEMIHVTNMGVATTPQTSVPINIPLMAGGAVGVLVVVVVMIVGIACCCTMSSQKQRNKVKKGSKSQVQVQVCEHCNATLSSTSPDSLACGCPIGAPPGSHSNHSNKDAQSILPDDVEGFHQDVDMVLTLYENPGAHMYTDPEELKQQMPCDEPPPYSENMLLSKQEDCEVVNISPTTEETPMINRLPPPHMLSMKTFRPLDDRSRPLSPFANHHPAMLRHPRSDPHHSILMDQSRRDSGVLVEEQESQTTQVQDTEEQEEQDHYNESIVVPKFNFQSLNYVNKSGLHTSGSSGGLSHGGGIYSNSRSRIQSKSSVESMELEHLDQLIESMNIHSDVPPV